jgi:hypothetical protein
MWRELSSDRNMWRLNIEEVRARCGLSSRRRRKEDKEGRRRRINP